MIALTYRSIISLSFTVGGKFNTSVPFMDINMFPERQLYIHTDVVYSEGSGHETDEDMEEVESSRIYFAVNTTSEELIAVEV